MFLPILLTILSCASSPGAPASNVSFAHKSYESFTVIGVVQPHWQPFASGISYFHGKIAEPLLEFWALQIELASPDIRIVVKGGAHDQAVMRSTKVTSFVRKNNLIAGINAAPFDVISAIEGRRINNAGIVISGRELAAPAIPQYDALVFYTDGTTAIVSQSVLLPANESSQFIASENIENAIGGFHQILKNGEPEERTLSQEARHPRSAAGISADGKYLYLLVVDGRRAGSIGSTEKETALLLRALGSWEGINFDGGGSSSLALRFPNGRVRPVNTPIHGGIPGLERAVAGCLGISLQIREGL